MTTKLILGLAIAGLAAAWIGSNHTPAYAANQIQMWHEFKPEVSDRTAWFDDIVVLPLP